MEKQVYIVYGVSDLSDYMNSEGDFLGEKSTALAVCSTVEKAKEVLQNYKQLGLYDDYEIIPHDLL